MSTAQESTTLIHISEEFADRLVDHVDFVDDHIWLSSLNGEGMTVMEILDYIVDVSGSEAEIEQIEEIFTRWQKPWGARCGYLVATSPQMAEAAHIYLIDDEERE